MIVLAAGLCGCAHAPMREVRPAAFEARWLEMPRSVTPLDAPRQQVNEFDLGKFLVIETNDVYLPEGMVSFIVDAQTILAAAEEKLDYLKNFLKAAYPNLADGPTAFPASLPVVFPYFTTLDSYISGLKESQERREKIWAAENPGQRPPSPGTDLDKLRAELQGKLDGRDAMVLRYVNARERDK